MPWLKRSPSTLTSALLSPESGLKEESRCVKMICPHGQERGPIEIRFSTESRYQPADVTWLSSLP